MSLFDEMDDPPYVQARNRFDEGLAAIESKYLYWFEKRSGLFEWQNHDVLSNHHHFYRNGNEIRFWFDKDSEVPADIKLKCSELF